MTTTGSGTGTISRDKHGGMSRLHKSPLLAIEQEGASFRSVGVGKAVQRNLKTLKHLLTSAHTPKTPDAQKEATPFINDAEQEAKADLKLSSDARVDFSAEIEDLIHFVDQFQFSPAAEMHPHRQKNRLESSSGPSIQYASLVETANLNPCSALKTPRSALPRRLHCGPLVDRSNMKQDSYYQDIKTTKSNLEDRTTSEDHPIPMNPDALEARYETTKQPEQTKAAIEDIQLPLVDPDNRSELESLHLDNHTISTEAEEELRGAGEKPSVSNDDWDRFNQLTQKVESALQDAWNERQSAQHWAMEVRQTTLSWVEDQRMAIERERVELLKARKSIAGDQNSEDIDGADKFERCIQGLELGMKTSELHHQTNAKRLHQSIKYQQDSLRKLEDFKGLSGVETMISPTSWMEQQDVEHTFENHTLDLESIFPWPSSTKRQDKLCGRHFGAGRSMEVQKKISFADSGTTGGATPSPEVAARPQSTRPVVATTVVTPNAQSRNGWKSFERTSTTSGLVGPKTIERTSSEHKVVQFLYGAQEENCNVGSSTVRFPNGDMQMSCANGSVAYYHADSKVIQVATIDGSEIYEFPNRQVERHYPDGRKIMKFPDGTKKKIFADGTIETRLPGGYYVVVERSCGFEDVRYG